MTAAISSRSRIRFSRRARSWIARRRAGERLDRIVEAGVADRRRHLVGEAAGEVLLGRRPVADPVLVHDEQADRLAAEDDRDEADADDPVSLVDLVEGERSVGGGVAEDDDALGPDRLEARRVGVRVKQLRPSDDLCRDVVMGGQRERERPRSVVEPEADPA